MAGAGSEVPPSQAPFKGLGARGGRGRRSEGRRGLHPRKASRRASRGLEGGFKRLQVLLVVVGLDMCKVCTTVYIPQHLEHGLHYRFGHCKVCTTIYIP